MAHTILCGIYCLRNLVTGDLYIGSSNSIKRRWYEHRHLLMKGTHGNPFLQAAWNKYEGSFICDVLELTVPEALLERECHFVATMSPRYNIAVVERGTLGRRQSEGTREKIAEARRGKKHSAETRAKMSAAAKARGMSKALRAAQRLAVTGRPRSEEVKAKISASHRRRHRP